MRLPTQQRQILAFARFVRDDRPCHPDAIGEGSPEPHVGCRWPAVEGKDGLNTSRRNETVEFVMKNRQITESEGSD